MLIQSRILLSCLFAAGIIVPAVPKPTPRSPHQEERWRQLKTGDTWGYRIALSFFKPKHTIIRTVTADHPVSPKGVPCFTIIARDIDGKRLPTTNIVHQDETGSVYNYAIIGAHHHYHWGGTSHPAALAFKSPMYIGEKWTIDHDLEPGVRSEAAFEVQRLTTITVPAGTFRAYQVHVTYYRVHMNGRKITGKSIEDITADCWDVPSIGTWVKQVVVESAGTVVEELLSYHLAK